MTQRIRWLALLVSVWPVGCRCEQDEARPYTPFAVASSPAAAAPPSPSAAPTGLPTPLQVGAMRHEPPAERLNLGGLELVAPTGLRFAQTLPYRPTSSDERWIVGWLVPANGASGSPGALYAFDGHSEARRLADFPPFVPTQPGCTHTVDLLPTEQHGLTLDIAAQCRELQLAARTPVRSLRVLAPEQSPPTLHALRLAAPAPGEQLLAKASTEDRDGDGHADVLLTFTLETPVPAREVAVPFVWLSRAAGVARDLSEPSKALADIGSVELVRANGKKTSEGVEARVRNARRLIHLLCAESGSSSLTDEAGNGVECGDLSRARAWFAEAEVAAALTRTLHGEALLLAELRNWHGDTGDAAERAIGKRVAAAIAKRPARRAVLDVTPRDPGPTPALSPLAFASDGSLLIQTSDGVLRHTEANGTVPADDEIDAWPLVLPGPDGEALTGLVLPCEKPLVEVQARSKEGTLAVVSTGRWLAPRPSACSGASPNPLPELRPIRWSREGLSALLGSAWLGPDDGLQAPALGSPVSPNGQHWVASTSFGLFVQHESESELWDGSSDAGRACVVANDGRRVACLHADAVALYTLNSAP